MTGDVMDMEAVAKVSNCISALISQPQPGFGALLIWQLASSSLETRGKARWFVTDPPSPPLPVDGRFVGAPPSYQVSI